MTDFSVCFPRTASLLVQPYDRPRFPFSLLARQRQSCSSSFQLQYVHDSARGLFPFSFALQFLKLKIQVHTNKFVNVVTVRVLLVCIQI